MKKLISFVLLFALLASLCACAAQEETATQPSGVPTLEEMKAQMEADKLLYEKSPEEMYGHIDQTQMIDGYYKLWNAEGVKLIAQYPDAKFQLLCHIDMGGIEIAPIPEFTGTLDGLNFTKD